MNPWANPQNPPREALQQEMSIDPRLRLNPNQQETPSRLTHWVNPNVINSLHEMPAALPHHQPSNQPATPKQKPQNVGTWANQQNQPTPSTANPFIQQSGPFEMQSDTRKRPLPSQPENPPIVKRDRIERSSSKLMLLNIPDYLDRQKIETAFTDFVSNPKVFIVTREDMGDKCSFAYVDLGSPALVRRWMETFEGQLVLPNKVVIAVEAVRAVPDTLTWTCAACSTTQSMANAFCERCSVIREESEDMIARGTTLIGLTPTDTLLLRCLPKGVTGPRIAEGLSRVSQLVPIVHIHLGKSRRFAFVQMSSIDHAKLLMVSFQQAPLFFDGQRVLVSYSRLSFPEWKAQQNRQMASVQPENPPPSKPTNIVNVQEGVANNLLASTKIVQDLSRPPPMLLPQTMQTFAAPTGFDASRPPPIIIQGPPPGNLSFGTPIILAPGTFPQSGLPLIIQQPGQLPQTLTVALPTGIPLQTSSIAATMAAAQPLAPPGGVIGKIDTPFGTFPQYIAPNIPSFADDPASGYKVDMVTMFYFDPKTNYHYSNTLNKWCIWEPMYATYIPVDKKKEMAQKEAENKEKADSTTSEEPKKSGQDIAREMMKWSLKREKEKTKISLTLKKEEPVRNRVANPTQDLGLRVLEKMQNPLRHLDRGSSEDEESAMVEQMIGQKKKRSRWGSGDETSTSRHTPPPANITEPEPDRDVPSAQQQREEMERNLIDRPNKTCLLCRRAFASLDVLDKHVERSDLHKTNLEMKRVEWGKAYVAQMMAAMANE